MVVWEHRGRKHMIFATKQLLTVIVIDTLLERLHKGPTSFPICELPLQCTSETLHILWCLEPFKQFSLAQHHFMCLRLSARRILQRYASNLANLVSSDKIRHVFIPSYQYRYASSYWLFCRWFLWKMQNIWRPGFLSKEIPASHADTDCWQSDEWNDWDGERDVKLRPLCLERNLQWFYGQLNYTAPEQKWSRNQYLQHDRSQTCLTHSVL